MIYGDGIMRWSGSERELYEKPFQFNVLDPRLLGQKVSTAAGNIAKGITEFVQDCIEESGPQSHIMMKNTSCLLTHQGPSRWGAQRALARTQVIVATISIGAPNSCLMAC